MSDHHDGEMDAPKGLTLTPVGATERPCGAKLMPVAPTATAVGLITTAQGW